MYQKNKIGRPLKFTDSKEVERILKEYVDKCIANDEPILITGMAVALDTDRVTLLRYENEEGTRDNKDICNTLKKYKMIAQEYSEKALYGNKNVAGVIFSMKNNHGYVDKIEVNDTTSKKGIFDFIGNKEEE